MQDIPGSKWTLSQPSKAFQVAKKVATGSQRGLGHLSAIPQGLISSFHSCHRTTYLSVHQLCQLSARCGEAREIFTNEVPCCCTCVQDITNNSRQHGVEQSTRATCIFIVYFLYRLLSPIYILTCWLHWCVCSFPLLSRGCIITLPCAPALTKSRLQGCLKAFLCALSLDVI